MEQFKDEQALVSANAEKNLTEQEKSQTAEADTQASFGKFKDVNALLTAYNNLEAEFTKRCQKVKELEEKISAVDKASAPTQTEVKEQALSGEEKDDILKSYLRDLLSKKQRAIVLDGAGVGVKTPVARAKTFEQAGELAKEILNKR